MFGKITKHLLIVIVILFLVTIYLQSGFAATVSVDNINYTSVAASNVNIAGFILYGSSSETDIYLVLVELIL